MIKKVKKYMTDSEFKRLCCWCGRLKDKGGLCPVHKGKPKPQQRQKQSRFSGYSKHQEDTGGFQQSGHS